MKLTKDQLTPGAERQHPDDPQKIGSGSAQSPGGSGTPPEDVRAMGTGQEDYPGSLPEVDLISPGGTLHIDVPGYTPPAGDVDPDSTESAEETGQDGVPDRPGKDRAHAWNE